MSHPDPKIAAEIEAAYAERAAQLQQARADLWAARGQGRDAIVTAAAAVNDAASRANSARCDAKAVFGPNRGLGAPSDEAGWAFAGDGASAHNWRAAEAPEEGRAR